jgi:hypothetical protein
VARHQGVDRAEQDCGTHGEEDGARVPAHDVAKPLTHAAIKPVLNGDERLHRQRGNPAA